MTHRSRFRRRDQPRWYGPLGVLVLGVVLAIGYVAYDANSGLPWQSRYRVTVEVHDALRLVRGSDVRIHGVLIGAVLSVEAQPGHGATPAYARLQLALDPSVGRLPDDTTVQVRPASALGLTYVDLRRGSGRRTIPDHGTLPLSQSRPTVDLPNLLDVFDHGAAAGFRRAIASSAYAVAGRGAQINSTIAATSRLVPALRQVSATLAARVTQLKPFLRDYHTLIAGLARVARPLAALIGDGAVALGAVAGARSALGAILDSAPAAEAVATQALVDARPGLESLAQVVLALRPAGGSLPPTLRRVDAALASGIAPLAELPALGARLRAALTALGRLSRAPGTAGALRKLLDLELPTAQVLSVLTPAQVRCNVLAMWGQYGSGAFLGFGTGQGPALGNLVVTGLGARGELLQSAAPAPNLAINPVPHENAKECEAGNEPWSGHRQLNNPPGLQRPSTRRTAPPPGVRALAARAGMLAPVEGAR
jgi:virulence factor Mce-like protein